MMSMSVVGIMQYIKGNGQKPYNYGYNRLG